MKHDFGSDYKWPESWRTGRCPLAAKSLLSSQTLKPLFPILFLLLVVVYGLADRLRNFVVGIFIPQYHYPYAVALCFAQVLVSLLFLNLLHLLGLVPLKHYSRSLGERLLLPAICNSVQAVLAMWVKASGSYASVFLLILPVLAPMTVGFSFALKVETRPSVHISVLLCILSGTSVVITAFNGLSGIEPLECMYAPLALILHGLALTLLAKVSKAARCHPSDAQTSVFDIYYTEMVNQSWVLGLLWLLHPDTPWQVVTQGSWHSLLFHGYLLAILLLGMVLNFLVDMSALCVSPLSAALLHSAKQLVQPFILLWLH